MSTIGRIGLENAIYVLRSSRPDLADRLLDVFGAAIAPAEEAPPPGQSLQPLYRIELSAAELTEILQELQAACDLLVKENDHLGAQKAIGALSKFRDLQR